MSRAICQQLGDRIMTSKSSPSKSLSQKHADMLGALLQEALLTGRRQLQQFSQLAALARAVASLDTPALDRARFITLLQDIATEAEGQAQLDVDMFQSLLGGRMMKRQKQQEAHQREDVFVVPANATRH
jgi:hypothetical protein